MKPYKNVYKTFECSQYDWTESYTDAEAVNVDLYRHTFNKPRYSNLWDLFGLGFFIGAKEDVQIED